MVSLAIREEEPPRSCGSRAAAVLATLSEYKSLCSGLVYAQLGMVLINFGVTYGLTALGTEAGSQLPELYSTGADSPVQRYSDGVGLFLLASFVALLGTLATLAEPLLNVLGNDVQELTRGEFTKRLLVLAVAVGVAVGMLLGLFSLLYSLDLFIFLIALYVASCVMAHFCKDKMVNMAWDSAGVATGPVNVPFLLALGIALAQSGSSSHGFGIVACASAVPVFLVELANLAAPLVARCRSALPMRQLRPAPRRRRRSRRLSLRPKRAVFALLCALTYLSIRVFCIYESVFFA